MLAVRRRPGTIKAMAERFSTVVDRPEPTLAVVIAHELPDQELDVMVPMVDVAEFRVDLMPHTSFDYLTEQVGRVATRMPTLLTVRLPEEGGAWSGSDEDRLTIFGFLLPQVDAIDVELEADIMPTVLDMASASNTPAVVSRHHLHDTPDMITLGGELDAALDAGADYVKFATRVDTPADYRRLKTFTVNNRKDGLITVGMGELGSRSRIELFDFGNRMTYAHDGHGQVAPGQMDYRQTHAQLLAHHFDYADLIKRKMAEAS
jgi:3-dehydroquinate dehydratase-1